MANTNIMTGYTYLNTYNYIWPVINYLLLLPEFYSNSFNFTCVQS